MIRSLASLAAVSLVLVQPTLSACQCVGCAPEAPTANANAAFKPSCCNDGNAADRTCCGRPAGQFPCDSCKDDGDSRGGSSGRGQACLCSAPSQPTAIATSLVQVDHSFGAQDFMAPAIGLDTAAAPLPASLASLGEDSPGRYGGLRIHAFLSVWLI